jgi:hypothetical protein
MKIAKNSSGKKILKISKKEWMRLAESLGIIKVSMAAWLGDDIKQQLKGENWLVDLMADKVPPQVGIKKLKEIDPDVALSLPRIYNWGESDVREIDGRQYIIIDVPKKILKRKPTYVRAIDINTGDVRQFDIAEVMPYLEEQATPLAEETMKRANEEIKLYNERLNAIDKATANISLLPLQLGRVAGIIDKRVEELDVIIGHSQEKLDQPKPEPMSAWENEMQNQLLTGDLDEITFVDTALQSYKYNYKQLVEDLKTVDEEGNPKAPNLPIPANIQNPELLRAKLINMGELAFQEYVDSVEKRKQRSMAPGVDFDIDAIDFGELEELTIDDIPQSHQVPGYKSWESYEKTLIQKINGSRAMKNRLLDIKESILELGRKLGSLEAGQRSNDYLQNTEEGQELVDELKEFINEKLGKFVSQYKTQIIKDGKIDRKKMGSAGSIGNGILVVAFGRLYQVISAILKKLGAPPAAPDRGIEQERIEQERVEVENVEEGAEEPFIANSIEQITKMSETLWNAFENRMRLK